MKHFDLLPPPLRGVHAQGTTKAALFEAALAGVFTAAAPQGVGGVEQERTFALAAGSAGDLLVAVLGEALRLSREQGESYDIIRFSLITDARAEGVFVGRAVEGFGSPVVSVALSAPPARNPEGRWEARFTLSP